MTKGNTVVVLGGSGAVGAAVCESLVARGDIRVIVAGRNLEKARRLSDRLGVRAEPAKIDSSEPSTYEPFLVPGAVLVNCVGSNNVAVASHCLARSVNYVDISATADIVNEVRTLDPIAQKQRATAAVSVGVAPGLTNLLVRYAVSQMGAIERADIFVLLGLGERHGTSAIEWTLSQFQHPFVVQSGGISREVRAFSEASVTTMPEPFGRRVGYRFDFSDQHTVRSTLDVESANSWLCFDSRVITKVLWCLAKTRFFSVFPLSRWSAAISRLSRRVSMGGTEFVVQVDATGINGQTGRFSLVGEGEARITGFVAASVADYLLQFSAPRGVLHLEQILDLGTLLGMLGEKLSMTERVSACGTRSSGRG